MYPHCSTSPTPQQNLRRRYQAAQEQKLKNGFRSSARDASSLDGSGGVELSMHLPARPFGNRFEVLREPSPTQKRNADRYITHCHRRNRSSRGSKEAKKCRDARRNWRKRVAAQRLDEQLSRNISQALGQANIVPPPPYRVPSPPPTRPFARISAPPPSYVSPTPPQLPCFNFGNLDLVEDILPPNLPKRSPTPLPPSVMPPLPRWSPVPLPPWMSSALKWSETPLCWDLSGLPEPHPQPFGSLIPTSGCRELQLWQLDMPRQMPMMYNSPHEILSWQPEPYPLPKKQSRFFPSPVTQKPQVNLPPPPKPTACKLHAADQGQSFPLPMSNAIAESMELASRASEGLSVRIRDEGMCAKATNLWNILTETDAKFCGNCDDPYATCFAHSQTSSVITLSSHMNAYDAARGPVGILAELHNTEVPYIHANSLTGHGNERASMAVPGGSVDNPIIVDSDVSFGALLSPPVGPNAPMAGRHIEVGKPLEVSTTLLDLPSLPPSPILEGTQFDLRANLRTFTTDINGEEVCAAPDAHFQSEQSLFELPPPVNGRGLSASSPSSSSDEDLIDVEDFLKLGHTDACWCRDCEDPAQLVSDGVGSEYDDYDNDDDTFDPVDDGGWVLYPDISTDVDDSGTSEMSAWEWEWGTVVTGDGEEDMLCRSCVWWEPAGDVVDFHSCIPSTLAHRAW